MTNTKENQNILTNSQWSQFASDFLNKVKHIKNDEKALVDMVKCMKFANEKKKISWDTGEHIALVDKDDNVKMTVKVSNAVNIAPEVEDKIVGELNVISVWTPWNNIEEIIRLIKG